MGNGSICPDEDLAHIFPWAQIETTRTTWHLRLKTWRKETFRLLQMRQLNFWGYRAGQRKGTISHSILHFLRVPVSLPYMCHRFISSSHCQGIDLDCSRNPDASKPGHTTCFTVANMTTTAQRTNDFIHTYQRATTRGFKTATFYYQPWQEFQPTISSHCRRRVSE